jgi:hypothetical protein
VRVIFNARLSFERLRVDQDVRPSVSYVPRLSRVFAFLSCIDPFELAICRWVRREMAPTAKSFGLEYRPTHPSAHPLSRYTG